MARLLEAGCLMADDGLELIRYVTARSRGLLAAVILGAGIAFLDSTVVNVALPTIGRDLSATFAQLQWVVTGYTLTLAPFILLGGSLAVSGSVRSASAATRSWSAEDHERAPTSSPGPTCSASSHADNPIVSRG